MDFEPLKIARLVCVLSMLQFPTLVLAQTTLNPNSGINANDTYCIMDVTLQSQNTTTLDQAVYNPQIGANTTTLNLSKKPTHFHLEAGFNSSDQLIVNLYSTDAATDPTAAVVDDISKIQIVNGKIAIFDQSGNSVPLVIPMNAPLPLPLALLSKPSGKSLLYGMITSSPSQMASSSGATMTMTTSSALLNGSGTTSVAQLSYTSANSPGPGVWSYEASGSLWILAQVAVTPDPSTTIYMQVANMVWNTNSTGDARRAAEGVPGTALPPRDTVGMNPFTASAATGFCPSVSEGQPSQFAQNFVFEHGIKSDPSAFTKRMDAWLTGDFQLGLKFMPCTNSFDHIANQVLDAASQIGATGQSNFVMLGHSQGGLISRDVAQHHPELIKGVITLDTPNKGALLALTGKAALINGSDKLIGRLLGDADCSSPFDNAACFVGELMVLGINVEESYAFDSAFPATVDLQPGSAYLNTLNAGTETFPRISIEGHSSRRWIEVRLLGDEFSNPEALAGGRNLVAFTNFVYIALRACSFIALLYGDFDSFIYCFDIANDMDIVDLFYNGLITPPGGDTTDGIVEGSSQEYPGGGTDRIVINKSDSHTGVIKSDKDRAALDTILSRDFLVPHPGCTYTFSPISANFNFAGGDGSISVSTQAGCIWSAVASDAWIAVLAGHGSGPGSIPFQVNLNLSPAARTGNITITVAASALTTAITQDPAPADGVATQDVTISGSEQILDIPQPCESDFTVCPPDNIIYDFGTMNISVNGHNDQISYGNDDPTTLASAFASTIHNDAGSPVDSTSFGATVHLIARLAGTAPVLWPITCSSATGDPTDFSGASFGFSSCPPILNNVAGSRALVTESSSSCESWGVNRIDCFVRGSDNTLDHSAFNGTSWTPFASLGTLVIGSRPSCVSWSSNRIDCFTVGSDQALWHQWWDGTQFQGPESLGGSLTSNPSCTTWGVNRLDCFARGTDQALWHIAFNGTAWLPWESLSGILTSGPSCVSWGSNRIDCFVLGTDYGLYQQFYNGSTWSGWAGLGGIATSAPSCESWGVGRLDCFVRGTNGAMHHRGYNGAWAPWEDLGGIITSAPSCVSWGSNRIDCFARGTDNNMYHRWWDGVQWNGWEFLGGITMASGPNCESWGLNRLDCFSRGTDNALWHRAWNGSQWVAWESLGGSLQ